MSQTHYRIEFSFGIEKDKEGLTIPRSESLAAIEDIRKTAANTFGGYTMIPTRGGWLSPSGKFFSEDGYILFTIQPTHDARGPRDYENEINNMARFIAIALGQQAVAVSITPTQFKVI